MIYYCPICYNQSVLKAQRYPYKYFQCSSCRSSWLSPQPLPSEIEEFYAHYHADGSDENIYGGFEEKAGSYFPAVLSFIKKNVSQGKDVLDVGCGRGGFLKLLSDAGYKAEGIDLSHTAVQHIREVLKLEAHCGDLVNEATVDHQFDAIVLLATIEHLANPLLVMKKIYSILRPGGLVVITTGIAGDLCDTLSPGSTQWYNAPEHLWVFSRKGLTLNLEKAGFTPCYVDTCFERSVAKRYAKMLRNNMAALFGSIFWFVVLGRSGLSSLRLDAKLPYGNQILIAAKKR